MKNMENGPERQAIIDEMQAIARHDAPWLWGYFPKQFALRHAWYLNAKTNLMANNTLKYRRIEPQLRAQLQAQWNKPVRWPLGLLAVSLLLVLIPAWIGYQRRQRIPAQWVTR
jgi:oligopeptide transport system substrate-binding protein